MKKKLDQDLKNNVGSFGMAEWDAGYEVAKIVKLKRTKKEFRIRKLSRPKILKGVAYPYFIETVEVNCDTGKVTLLKKPWGLASTEEKAKETAEKFRESFNTEQSELQKKGQDLEDQLRSKNSEAGLRPISLLDLENVSKSRQIILRGNFPSLFAVKDAHPGAPDNEFLEDCQRAYILDLARLTGKVPHDLQNTSAEFVLLLAPALKSNNRRKPNTKRNLRIDAELARGLGL